MKLGSKINAITPTYATMLGIIIQKTNIGAWKIDILSKKTYDMASLVFLL